MEKKKPLRELLGTVILATFLDIFEKLPALTEDRFLACIYGGICVGIGTAIILKANASTGGTDLISHIVKSYKPYFKAANIIVIADIIIVLLNVIVFKEVEIGLYSAIAIYLVGKMIDTVFEGIHFTKSMFIVSDKYEEIAIEVSKQVSRGSTGICSKGMYSNKESMMLWCVGSRSEVAQIKEIVKVIDKTSFIVISSAREAWGKGFYK